MRRAAIVLLALTPLVAAGCTVENTNAGDSGNAGLSTTRPTLPTEAPDAGATTTTAAPAGTDPAATVPMPMTDPSRCEDVPAAVDHPLGEAPLALRPCTAPSKLQINVIHDGTGRAAQNGDTLIVDYTGVLSSDGTMFDTSYLRGVPFDFVLGRGGVIVGWDIGLLGTTAGTVVKLDVPGDMAYADTPPSDAIPKGAALTFVVEVHAVIAPTAADDAPRDLLTQPSTGATVVGVVDVQVGDGATVETGHTVVVHLLLARGDDLSVLLDTWAQSDPIQIIMADGESLPGLIDGLAGARVGTTRVITIPPDDAFGPDGEPGLGLPAGVDLIVVAHVVGVY